MLFEPWSGLSTSLEEGDHLEDKKNVRLLEPGQVDQIGFDIEIFLVKKTQKQNINC